MKKFVLALLAIASVSVANAQKGSILLYGNAGINASKADNGGGNENKNFNWNINPGIGYQFTDNITLGVQGGFMNMRNTVKTPTTETVMKMPEFQAGIFARYGMRINNMFTLYDQLDLSYVGGKSTTDVETNGVSAPQVINSEYNGFHARLFPGLQMFVKDGMALNFSFGGLEYRTVTTDVGPTSTTTSSFDFTMWRQFNFGISYNITKGCCKKGGGHAKPGDDLRPMTNNSDDDE